MRTPIFISLICLTVFQSSFGQYQYNFEFEESMLALESTLVEFYPEEEFKIFNFNADSLYQDLINTGDSVTVSWGFGSEYVFDVILNDYSVAGSLVENPSGSFSKKGKIIGNDTSVVYAHFSPNYFWIEITIGLKHISIQPVRGLNESFSSYSDTYLIKEITTNYNQPIPSNSCEDLFIEIYIIADQLFYDEYKQDEPFIIDNTKLHLMRFEKFLNQTFRPLSNDGDIFVQAVVIDLDHLKTNMYFDNEDRFLDEVRNDFASRNTVDFPCLFPDLYLGLTGINFAFDGVATQSSACHKNPPFPVYPDLPGLSLVSFGGLGTGFEFTEDLANKASTKIAHELCHQFGAGHATGSPCGTSNCTLMCDGGCNSFSLDISSKNTINGHFNNRCLECYSSFTDPNACLHCDESGELVTYRDFPMIANCESENEFTVFYYYQNDCDQVNVDFTLSYQTNQVQVIDQGNFSEDINLDFGDRLLQSINVSLDPEEQILKYVTFKLINNPLNYAQINNVQLSFKVLEGGFPVFQIHNSDLDLVTYVVPKEIIGTKNLSELLEPQSGYIFDSDNTSGCTVNNDAFSVNGTLYIDNDYCFNNTSILLEAESSIVIKDGYSLNLSNCKVSGCSELSFGFVIEDGGSLELNDSQIEDALIGIELKEGSSLITKNTKYLNNLYGIRASLPSYGDVDLNILEGNEFSSNRSLKFPHEGRQSFMGVSLQNVNACLISGTSNETGSGLNRFSNSTFGIELRHSNAIINNFKMESIKKDPNYLFERGRGVFISGKNGNSPIIIGNSNIEDNIFKNCDLGIEANSTDLEIKYSKFLDCNLGIFLGYSSKGNIKIHDNKISSRSGVSLINSFGLNVDITNNVIDRFAYHGIQTINSWGKVNMIGNQLYISNSNGYSGIKLLRSQNVNIRTNEIRFVEANYNIKGLSLESSSNCVITKNNILGNNAQGSIVGFYSQDSPYNAFLCNSATSVKIAEQHVGTGTMTVTAYNQYNWSGYGLLLGSEQMGSESIIGPQFHHRNKWTAPNYAIKPAWSLSGDPVTNQLSRYTVDNSNNNQNYYAPSNLNELATIQFFIADENNSTFSPCSWIRRDNYTIPLTELNFETNSGVKNKLLRQQLFQALQFGWLDSVMNSSLNTFYNKWDTTDIGKLSKVEYYLYKAMTDTITMKDNHMSTALFYNSDLLDMDTLKSLETQTNEILAAYMEEGDIDVLVNNKEFINNTASLCPFQYGSAVYLNRALAKGMDFELEYEDLNLCGTIEPRSSGDVPNVDHHVYPNPVFVNQPLNVLSNSEIKDLIISDILGNIIYRKMNVNTNSIVVNLNIPGLYIINIKNYDGTNLTSKIIVINN